MKNKNEELTNIAYEFDKLTAPISMILNYISCIELIYTKATNQDEKYMLFYSLFGPEKGLSNISENLENIEAGLIQQVNKLLYFAKGEDTNG